jgi:hypothetical protein
MKSCTCKNLRLHVCCQVYSIKPPVRYSNLLNSNSLRLLEKKAPYFGKFLQKKSLNLNSGWGGKKRFHGLADLGLVHIFLINCKFRLDVSKKINCSAVLHTTTGRYEAVYILEEPINLKFDLMVTSWFCRKHTSRFHLYVLGWTLIWIMYRVVHTD